MIDLHCSCRMLALLLISSTLLTMPLLAEEPTPRAQESKPPPPKVTAPKIPEVKNPEPAPPELRQEPKQEPKPKEATSEQVPNTPARSLILTVKLALLSDHRTAPYTIEVDTKGQDVVLSGKVSSEAEKLAAAEVARQLDGVKTVVNKLDVVAELHQLRMQKQDQTITEYIKERFKKSATVDAARFDIKTENGVVELSGQTKFQVIVLEAAESARQVPGVIAVKTHSVRIEAPE